MPVDIEKILRQQELIDYTQILVNNSPALSKYFPERTIPKLDVKMFKGAYRAPVMAHVHGFDTAVEHGSRSGVDLGWVELLLVKRAMKVNERELIELGYTDSNEIIRYVKANVYNDFENLVNAVIARFEKMRADALQKGKQEIDENGAKVTIDYGMPEANLVTADWTDPKTSKPLEDIVKWVKQLTKNAIYPAEILTRSDLVWQLCENESVRKAFLGSNYEQMLTPEELNVQFQRKGLPAISMYDGFYNEEKDDGTLERHYYLDDKSFLILPANTLGETLYGPTAERVELQKDPSIEIGESNYITTAVYRSVNSPSRDVQAVATGMVTFPYAEQVISATVTH